MGVVEVGHFTQAGKTPMRSVLDALLWEVLTWCSYQAEKADFEERLFDVYKNKK